MFVKGSAGVRLVIGGCALLVLACTARVPEVRVEADAALGESAAGGAGASNLQRAVRSLQGPARVLLGPGHYVLLPSAYEDPTCGNCEDPHAAVPATAGLLVAGRGIHLVGSAPDSVIVHTNAGYGIVFDGCIGCSLRGVTVTGGVRDADGRATDGAIVVRRSSVTIERCRIRDNIGDSATVAATVVGIIGIVGREGADLTVRGCRVDRNSWDGIALYRGARAEIRDNVIDGVDRARGGAVGGGRGVGIGLTWDAEAVVEANLVRRYWKGIGVFVDAKATIRHNIVEDMLTWGVAYWGAAAGRPVAFIEENVVFETGACGAMLAQDSAGSVAPGSFTGNAVVRTAQDERYDSGEPYCTQRPLAREAIPPGFVIRNNLFHDNRQPGEAARVDQLSADEFRAAVGGLATRLAAREALRESRFLAAVRER